ncbi:MAG: hypothetical protein Q4G22_01670 [Paracoccus sp. (in: a-proteobacteria)]|uniref:hypothetical protein n=1 Tax=Paracoccus sp. TaxID=267 RepID=UPI0026DF8278|nr:hypothetical protein [Paracoccus sp. (in: a-proteobacteria)]MDO5630525.1 hypothetical protein [Paracoccus sp. (in: a-proteobacteria)]
MPKSISQPLTPTLSIAQAIEDITRIGLTAMAKGALIRPLTAASLLIVPSFVTNIWQLLSGPPFAALIRWLWPMDGDLHRRLCRVGLVGGLWPPSSLASRDRPYRLPLAAHPTTAPPDTPSWSPRPACGPAKPACSSPPPRPLCKPMA